MDYQSKQIESFKKAYSDHEYSEQYNLKIIKTQLPTGEPVLIIWKGRKERPSVRYKYHNVESMNAALEMYIKEAKELHDYKEKRKAERKNFIPTVKVGDIFASSWGYDQTNVSFYQIVEMPSKHYVIVRETTQKTLRSGGCDMSAYVTANKDEFSDRISPFKRKVVKLGESQGIKINSSEHASLWNGKEKFCSWYA